MFENIIKWIIDNKDSLISGVIGNGIFFGILQLYGLKNKIPNGLKKLTKYKSIKYLRFILLYILPIGTIILMTVDKTTVPTFKNISLFIIICVSLIFNILMSHIISIYRMFTELTSKSSENDLVHKKAINRIFEVI